MRAQKFDFDVDNVDPDGIADNNDSSASPVTLDGALVLGRDLDGLADNNDSSGSELTLDGALTSNGTYASSTGEGHFVVITDTATADQSGATFVVHGKDRDGATLIESITGPTSGATVTGSSLFKEISSIIINNGVACGTVDAGMLGIYKSVDGLAHQINIIDTATVDQSGATFTITGLDADGRVQSEDVTGPGSGATVESAKYFQVVNSITIASAASCGTVDVGTVDEFASQTIVLNHYADTAPTLQTQITGTINYDVQITLQNPFELEEAEPHAIPDQEAFAWVNDGNFGGKTASLIDDLAVPGARAMRVVSNSFTNTAEIQLYVTHPML